MRHVVMGPAASVLGAADWHLALRLLGVVLLSLGVGCAYLYGVFVGLREGRRAGFDRGMQAAADYLVV